MANSDYITDLNLCEDSLCFGLHSNGNMRISIQQEERFDSIDGNVYDSNLKEFLSINIVKEDKTKARIRRVITEKAKSSLIGTIVTFFQN